MINPFIVDSPSTRTTTEETINVSNFFISESNKQGYFLPSNFIAYGTDMRPKERQDTAGIFNEMKKGTKMDFNRTISIDRSGKSYLYLRFLYSRGVIGYKVIASPGMIRLIEDYFEGKIRVDVTAQELFSHAMLEG